MFGIVLLKVLAVYIAGNHAFQIYTEDNLNCQNSAIQCISNTSYTTCAKVGSFTVLLNARITCQEGYICNDSTSMPCVLPNSENIVTDENSVTSTVSATTRTTAEPGESTVTITTTPTETTTPTTTATPTTTDAPTTMTPPTTTTTTPEPDESTVTSTTTPTETTTPTTTAAPTTAKPTTTATSTTTDAPTTMTPPTTTTTTPEPVTRPSSPPNCKAVGNWPGPACNEYYECSKKTGFFAWGYKYELKTCSEGNNFDSASLQCLPADQSDCS